MRNVSQTREQHSLKALTTFVNISKSNLNDTYCENNRKTQRKFRHNSEKRILCFFLPCDLSCVALGVRRQSEDCKKCQVYLRNQTAWHSIYNRANSGMQSRDSLRNSPEMHCSRFLQLTNQRLGQSSIFGLSLYTWTLLFLTFSCFDFD